MNALPSRCRAALLAVVTTLCLSPAHAEEEKVLNLYNWSEYIGENAVRDFERETGMTRAFTKFKSGI